MRHLLIVLLFLISIGFLIHALKLLQLSFSHFSQLVSWAVGLADKIGNLTTANQRGDDGSADNEGENKPVDTVPSWSPAGSGGFYIGVVEEGEGEELSDEADFSTQEEGRPGDCCCDDTDGVARVALFTAEACPFETPMNGT